MASAAASLLDAETFAASSSRDALGRVLTAIRPDGSEVGSALPREGGAWEGGAWAVDFEFAGSGRIFVVCEERVSAMKHVQIESWANLSSIHLNEAALRRMHQPESREGKFYVASGTCRFSVDDEDVVLHAGEVVLFPGGAYRTQVLGEEPLAIVYVWPLPEDFRPRKP